MHAASRDMWQALKDRNAELDAGLDSVVANKLRRALTNYLLNYCWGLDRSVGNVDKYRRLLLALAYEHADEAKALVLELAPEATTEIDGYNERWRNELAGKPGGWSK